MVSIYVDYFMSENRPVYRYVNGELVRVPGDVRDPKRRYAAFALGHREFTDEEERQRDEEEAKWEAERPQREAEAKRQQEEAEKFRASLQYENRVVAFLDVLGWKNVIAQSCFDSELTCKLGIALKTIQGHVQMNEWTSQNVGDGCWPCDPQITHFSDCILLSVLADGNAAHELPFYLHGIVSNLLSLGFMVRGGIAAGLLIHRGSMAYGPALIRAYELESEYADVARIILDKPIAEAWGQGMSVQNKNGSLIGYQKTWRQELDGWRFYDFLQPFTNMPGIKVQGNDVDRSLAPVRAFIMAGLEDHKENVRVLAKYQWAAQYFNDILGEYPQSSLQIIGGVRD